MVIIFQSNQRLKYNTINILISANIPGTLSQFIHMEHRLNIFPFNNSDWYKQNNSNNYLLMVNQGLLVRFHEIYLEFHGYLCVLVCLFGIITNIINITVLAVKDMRTPTNNFLISLAVSDILTMAMYFPFSIHFYCPPKYPDTDPDVFSYGWIIFMIIAIQVFATTHAVAIWLAVSLAGFRFNQIRGPCTRGPLARERRIRHVKITIILVCSITVAVLIPNYLSHRIVRIPVPFGNNITIYGMQDNRLGTSDTDPVVLANLCIYAIFAKIIPCILIFGFSGSLLYHMGVKTTRRRHRLSVAIQQAKTTRMLLVVLIFFICTELPQGIMMLLSASVNGFYKKIFYNLGDFIDFISLLNNSVNFVIYCTMSQQFREKFHSMYIERLVFWRSGTPLQPSGSETLMLRDQAQKTNTTTTHCEDNQMIRL